MHAQTPERAAILISDIVGYTALTQQDEAQALKLLEEHRAVCRPLFARYHGREIKTMGDAFLVAFADPRDAVQCAIDIQAAMLLCNRGRPEDEHVWVRIGIHCDAVTYRGDDVYGHAVNVAARLEPLSDAGGVCISAQVHEQVKGLDVSFVSLGEQPLKNIREPVGIYKIVLPGSVENSQLATVQQPIQSLAVLPFENMGGDPDSEYFSDGLTDDITAQLNRIGALKVISRASAMQFKHSGLSPGDIGRALGVSALLAGSVRRQGNRVRIVARLVDVASGEQRWAEHYDRRLVDIFAIQIEVAEKIAHALQARISRPDRERMERTLTESPEAYHLYLKGRFHWARRTAANLHEAVNFFEQAIAKDPDYVQAYAGLSQVYSTLADWDCEPPKQGYAKALKVAEQARTLNPISAKAITSLAHVYGQLHWDWSRAEQYYQRALALNPGYSTARHWYAEFLAAVGRLDEAIVEIQRARELDPFSLQINASYGLILYLDRQFDRAIEQCLKTEAMNAEYFAVHLFLGMAYLQRDLVKEAIVECQRAQHAYGGNSAIIAGWLGYAHARAGNVHEATLVLSLFQQSSGYVSPFAKGLVHWGLGDMERACEAFEQAEAVRSLWLVFLLHVDPLFDPWRSEPHCHQLLKRMKLVH